MAVGLTTYYLFKRPQNGKGNYLMGPKGGIYPDAKGNPTQGADADCVFVQGATSGFTAVKEGDPWLLITMSNSIEGILEVTKVLAKTVPLSHLLILKNVPSEQNLRIS